MSTDTQQKGRENRGERAPGIVPEARAKRGQVQTGIADADKKARTGSEQEPVRNTPPGGEWNEVV